MCKRVDVEIILSAYNGVSKNSIISVVHKYLQNARIRPNSVLKHFQNEVHTVHNEILSIIVSEIPNYNEIYIDFLNIEINWYVYNLDPHGSSTHTETDGEGNEITLATHLALPSASLFNLWENLYYDNNIKQNLLRYAQTMMEFTEKGVDCNIISCNRVILLHGPPGTGKTSLCKALAHKLSIRLSERFSSGLLIEINSHSLFSKWFSESGKLVTTMFTRVKEIIENPNLFVCVLIDEVESLAHARDHCVSGTEPSDSIRVVNTMLTQIDQIKAYPNVLILATSNMTETIDLAFIDRADIKQYLGLPTAPAVYKIYHSCIMELMKAQIIVEQPLAFVETLLQGSSENEDESRHLLRISEKSLGLSGRSLRKVPFISHALFLNKPLARLNDFLIAMEKAVENELQARTHFKGFKNINL